MLLGVDMYIIWHAKEFPYCSNSEYAILIRSANFRKNNNNTIEPSMILIGCQ